MFHPQCETNMSWHHMTGRQREIDPTEEEEGGVFRTISRASNSTFPLLEAPAASLLANGQSDGTQRCRRATIETDSVAYGSRCRLPATHRERSGKAMHPL